MAAQEDIISTAAIYRSLVRLETKQDSILENQTEILTDHKTLKTRIDKVENRQHWYMGAVAAVSAAIAAFPKYAGLIQ